MKKIKTDEELRNIVMSLGNEISSMKSMAKCIDIINDDEINFNKGDIDNLISILNVMLQSIEDKFNAVEEYLGIWN